MSPDLPWLKPDEPFPAPHTAWGQHTRHPGLLAIGGALDSAHLLRAYRQGIFPWFCQGQPILWWSTDPRMVLPVAKFRLHRSLRRTLQKFRATPGCEIRIDSAFSAVMHACANTPRDGQDGTWIVSAIHTAYQQLHAAGYAHSVETWKNGELIGGLYCVAIGQAVFGESMFAHQTDASKIALAALVGLCRYHGAALIDCQQNTSHLASLGAHEIPRADFLQHIAQVQQQPAMQWEFSPLYWDALLSPTAFAA